MKNYYHILGLSFESNPEKQLIDAAYKALVKLYHPDLYKGDKKSLKRKITEIVNTIAPEHLELHTARNDEIIKGVKNAGSIFIGKFSPEAIGDYIAGPNHVLPTSGSARFSSGLSVNDFLKRHSLIKITKPGIERFGASVINLAKHENLDGHAYSVKIRLKKDK